MKRGDLIRHLREHGCELWREGGKHSVYRNPQTGDMTAVPRHVEIKNRLAREICRALGIEAPK